MKGMRVETFGGCVGGRGTSGSLFSGTAVPAARGDEMTEERKREAPGKDQRPVTFNDHIRQTLKGHQEALRKRARSSMTR